jgi:hypothetical protein
MPTLAVGQAEDLKYDDGEHRWWIDRVGPESGATHRVSVEELMPSGVWRTVHEYEPYASMNPRRSNTFEPIWIGSENELSHFLSELRADRKPGSKGRGSGEWRSFLVSGRTIIPHASPDDDSVGVFRGTYFYINGEPRDLFEELKKVSLGQFYRDERTSNKAQVAGKRKRTRSCSRGQIKRKAYSRKGTKVPSSCIRDRGRPGKGPKVVKITDKGSLGGKGFFKKSATARRRLLAKCVKDEGYRSCLGKLNALAVLGKREFPKSYLKKIEADRNWLVKKYGGKGSFKSFSNRSIKRRKRRLMNWGM